MRVRGSGLALVPLYLASAVLTVGEGAFGLLVPLYMHAIGRSTVEIGSALSTYGVVSLAARIPVGAVYRAQRAWPLIAGGTVLSSLSFWLLTTTQNPALLAAFASLDGAGFAIASTANMAALLDRRPAGGNAGSIMGWYTGSLGAGYAIAGVVGGRVGESLGAGHAMRVLAIVPLAAGVLLAAAMRAIPATAATGEEAAAAASPGSSWLRSFRGLPAAVWLAFFVTLYINLVSGVVMSFFPIYGLALGLTVAQIGFLQGTVHGVAAATVRFFSGVVFRWISYARALPAMIVLSGLSIAAIGGIRIFAVLTLAWIGIGLSRGILRVASAALVMDEAGSTDRQRGAASSVYLAGLDLGKVLGPIAGGVGAHLAGIRATFLLSSGIFPALYFVLAALAALRRRQEAKRAGLPARSTVSDVTGNVSGVPGPRSRGARVRPRP